MELNTLVFYLLAGLTLLSALGVVFFATNPIYSALSLALVMIGVAGLYFSLDAYFVAGVQLIVYAGAVLVMFVMVIMLFDLREEKQAFSRGTAAFFAKMGAGGFILGGLWRAIRESTDFTNRIAKPPSAEGLASTREMAINLFSRHLVEFELVGILLLVVLVGAIALAKSKGGTHA